LKVSFFFDSFIFCSPISLSAHIILHYYYIDNLENSYENLKKMSFDPSFFKEILSILREPVTSITDMMLSSSCFYFFYAIPKIKKGVPFLSDWRKFFLFLGISTFLGAIAHGIFHSKNDGIYDVVWIIMQLFSGLSVFYAQSAAFGQLENSKTRNIWLNISIIQFLIFGFSVFYFFNFKVVAINSLIAMIQLILIFFPVKLEDWAYRALISSGFMISFLTVYVHQQKLSYSRYFNYKDISHVIMYFSLLLIFRGIKYKYKPNSTALID
jgi:hypothetical protein